MRTPNAGPKDEFVRKRWASVARMEETDPERLLTYGGADEVTLALAARGKLSPQALEKKAMHMSAISAEEEARQILENTEKETGLEPTLTERTVGVVEYVLRELKGDVKRFDVEFKEPDRPQLPREEGENL